MYAADTHLDAEKIKKHHSNPSPSKLRKLRRCRLHQSESCTGRAVSWNWCWRWSSHWWIGNGIYGGIPDWRLLGFANPFQFIDFCLIWEEVLIAFPIAIWRETKAESAYRVGKLASMVCRLTRRWCLAKSIYCTFHNSLTLNGPISFGLYFFCQNHIGISLQALWRENSWTSSARPFARKTTHVELSVHWSARLTGWLWPFQ